MSVGLRGKPRRGQNEEISRQASSSERSDIHTALPGEVVAFDAEAQQITVRIQYVPKVLGEEKPYPELQKVPVSFPRGGGFAMTWPIAAGDPGELRFAERDMSAWYEEGGSQAGDSARMHDLSDAYFVPGGMVSGPQKLSSFNAANMELRTVDGQFKMEMTAEGQFRLLGSEGDIVDLVAEAVELEAEGFTLLGTETDLSHTAQYASIGAQLTEIAAKLRAMVIS